MSFDNSKPVDYVRLVSNKDLELILDIILIEPRHEVWNRGVGDFER
jgi:hypothetical protein